MDRKQIVPDYEKFKALVLYVCAKSEKYEEFGAVKLNKILYYSDVTAYRRHGTPITGETYVKRQRGPAPKRILPAQNELVSEGKLIVRDKPYYPDTKREFIVKEQPDISGFSPEEISLIDYMVEAINQSFTATEISNITHDDVWEILELGEEIPYHAIFSSHTGEIDETDIEWARENGIG